MDATSGAYVFAEKNTFKNTNSNSSINANCSNDKINHSNKLIIKVVIIVVIIMPRFRCIPVWFIPVRFLAVRSGSRVSCNLYQNLPNSN